MFITWDGIDMISILVLENADSPILWNIESFAKFIVLSSQNESKAFLQICVTCDGIVILVIMHFWQE